MDIIECDCVVRIENIEDIIFYKQRVYQEVVNLRELLKEKEDNLQHAQKYLAVNCRHNWVTDSIDSMKGFKEGIIIKYCEKCELSAKPNLQIKKNKNVTLTDMEEEGRMLYLALIGKLEAHIEQGSVKQDNFQNLVDEIKKCL